MIKNSKELLKEYLLFETHLHTNDTSMCARASVWQWKDFFKLNFPWIEALVLTNHSHSPGLYDSRIMSNSILLNNYDAIKKPVVFSGLEVNILKNGNLDLNQSTLENAKWVMAAINTLKTEYNESEYTSQNAKEITTTFKKIINSGVVDVIGHPTANIDPNESKKIKWEEVFIEAKKRGVIIEINLLEDIPEWWLKILISSGCVVSLGSDWHGFYHFRRIKPLIRFDEKEKKLWKIVLNDGRSGFDALDTDKKEAYNHLYLQKSLGQQLYDWHSTELIKAIKLGLQKSHVINSRGLNFLSNLIKKPKSERRKLISQL